MLGRATGAVVLGVEARLIEVEVDLAGGLPTISAVGLPDSAVREGIDRVRAALRHGGFKLPERRITFNLAPADVRKHGNTLDLPMLAALLQADRQIPPIDAVRTVMAGELGLDGTVRPVRGALCIALAARAAGRSTLLVPRDNADEAALVDGIRVVPLSGLADLVAWCLGKLSPRVAGNVADRLKSAADHELDLADVRGQAGARRAIEIAAAGGHHLLLSGPPGSGKTLLARRLPGILPPLTMEEALVVTQVWGAVGLGAGLVTRRPYRAPHHGISFAGLTGGGPRIRPGEISLATQGVLYLDELPEFRRDALEALRQPLEEGCITVARLHATATLPAAFTLVASMNPCRCGYRGAGNGRCECTARDVRRYLSKVSGPLLDRFDLVVDVPPVDLGALSQTAPGECSAAVRSRVSATRARQQKRFGKGGPVCNARMGPAELARWAAVSAPARRLLLQAAERFGITGRGFDRVRRVARTLADMEGQGQIDPRHIAEALQYRHPDPSAG